MLLALAGAARAAIAPLETNQPEEQPPPIMRWMVTSTKTGVRAILPIVDSDPNTGVTFGAMPIWVVYDSSRTIRQIHSLALSYNQNFGASTQYQYFLFPRPDTNFLLRLGASERFDREIVTEYSSDSFLGRRQSFDGRFEYSRDSSKRFFGLGANTPKAAESNYTLDTVNYLLALGRPVADGSPVFVTLKHLFQANEVGGGSLASVTDINHVHPEVFRTVEDRHYNASLRGYLEYDTRDSAITTSRGSYAGVFLGGAHKDTGLSEYSYYRYGAEAKHFVPWSRAGEPEPRFVTAVRGRFEDLRGDVPFWLLPELGGKYSLRAYGEGRYTDHTLLVVNLEQRCRVYSASFGGQTASFWLDPFLGLGTVADRPDALQNKFMRPVYGAALRVVARPQLVGSADFGVGQEGLKVFIDINYSF